MSGRICCSRKQRKMQNFIPHRYAKMAVVTFSDQAMIMMLPIYSGIHARVNLPMIISENLNKYHQAKNVQDKLPNIMQ